MTKSEDQERPQDKNENTVVKRCMICAKPGNFDGGICDPCKARIKGEAT